MTALVHVFDAGDDEEWRTYACLRRRPAARSPLLGESDLRRGFSGPIRVAGRFVAYSLLSVTGGTGDAHLTVAVADVARRRTRHRWDFRQFFKEPSLRVRGARLRRDESFAARPTVRSPTTCPAAPSTTCTSPTGAGRRRVDHGPRVRGFRATGRRVDRRNGERRAPADHRSRYGLRPSAR